MRDDDNLSDDFVMASIMALKTAGGRSITDGNNNNDDMEYKKTTTRRPRPKEVGISIHIDF